MNPAIQAAGCKTLANIGISYYPCICVILGSIQTYLAVFENTEPQCCLTPVGALGISRLQRVDNYWVRGKAGVPVDDNHITGHVTHVPLRTSIHSDPACHIAGRSVLGWPISWNWNGLTPGSGQRSPADGEGRGEAVGGG